MKTMRQHADALRAVADELVAEADARNSPTDLIRRHTPADSVVNYEVLLSPLYIGRSDCDARAHIGREAAHGIAAFIARQLEYEFSDDLARARAEVPARGNLRYCARIHALTPHQLTHLVSEAYAAGRASR